MGDIGDIWREVRDERRENRRKFGIDCPRCATARPKAAASILLPGQRCRVDGYVDPRGRAKRG